MPSSFVRTPRIIRRFIHAQARGGQGRAVQKTARERNSDEKDNRRARNRNWYGRHAGDPAAIVGGSAPRIASAWPLGGEEGMVPDPTWDFWGAPLQLFTAAGCDALMARAALLKGRDVVGPCRVVV